MDYDQGKHLDWWHSLSGVEHFALMDKHKESQITNKIVYLMYQKEL